MNASTNAEIITSNFIYKAKFQIETLIKIDDTKVSLMNYKHKPILTTSLSKNSKFQP